ncbi:MAG: glycosyltransferase [Akkermansiaceae bacterium]
MLNIYLVRIEIITDTFLPDINGVAMTLGRFVEGLRSMGHLVYIMHTGVERGQGESVMKSMSLPGYPEVRMGLPSKLKLTKRWSKKKPDVIYVATESLMGLSAIKVANKMGIPVAAGFHTNFHTYLKKYKMGTMHSSAITYLRNVHSRADCTIVPSQDVKDMLEKEGFQNIKIVGRGVDTELFHPSKRCANLRMSWGARASTPVVMVVGRVAAEKNLQLAVRAFDQMRVKVPDLCCIMVGDGPLRQTLEHANPHIHFSGNQTGEELAKHYASADILLFPSETETFGNVLLEGMASGALTVAYDYAAAKVYMQHLVNGFAVPLGDEEMFVHCALKAVLDKQYQDLRIAGRETMKSINWQAATSLFEQHLKHIMIDSNRTVIKRKKRKTLDVRTLILSDIHLGTDDSKAREVIEVLKHIRCERIILNGDIIDGWALKRGKKWRNIHTRVIRILLKKMEKEEVEIVYLRGNHDDFMERFLPIKLDRLDCVKEYIHVSAKGDKYLVVHGDGFDSVSTGHKWIAMVGAVGYDFLLSVNRVYNKYRSLRGKDYYSVSKAIKGRVKSAVNFVSSYEEKLIELAVSRGCTGIICGHIHTPADEVKDGVHYLNSGDWVETMSCIVEDKEGNFSVLYYEDIIQQTLGDDDKLRHEGDDLWNRENSTFQALSRTQEKGRYAAKEPAALAVEQLLATME